MIVCDIKSCLVLVCSFLCLCFFFLRFFSLCVLLFYWSNSSIVSMTTFDISKNDDIDIRNIRTSWQENIICKVVSSFKIEYNLWTEFGLSSWSTEREVSAVCARFGDVNGMVNVAVTGRDMRCAHGWVWVEGGWQGEAAFFGGAW